MELSCPFCHQPLQMDHHHAWCDHGHTFDRSKQGYFNLVRRYHASSGDDRDMVNKRIQFLNQGHYDFLVETIKSMIEPLSVHSMVDIACGPGYYLSQFMVETKYGLDLSKSAIQYAAKHDPTSQYLIANGFELPFINGSIDLVTVIFAPYSIEEIQRILKPGGYFIRVSPGAMHLFEIKQLLYPKVYVNRYKPIEDPNMKVVQSLVIAKQVKMDGQTMASCFDMTPYRYKTNKMAVEQLIMAPPTTVTIEFHVDLVTKGH